VQCFCRIIRPKDRFEEYAKALARVGTASSAEHQAPMGLIQRKATQGKHERAAKIAASGAAVAGNLAAAAALTPPSAASAAAAAPRTLQVDAGAGLGEQDLGSPELVQDALWRGILKGGSSPDSGGLPPEFFRVCGSAAAAAPWSLQAYAGAGLGEQAGSGCVVEGYSGGSVSPGLGGIWQRPLRPGDRPTQRSPALSTAVSCKFLLA
jgi:hypothetical protein